MKPVIPFKPIFKIVTVSKPENNYSTCSTKTVSDNPLINSLKRQSELNQDKPPPDSIEICDIFDHLKKQEAYFIISFHIFRIGVKNRNWTAEEEKLLKWAVSEYSKTKNISSDEFVFSIT